MGRPKIKLNSREVTAFLKSREVSRALDPLAQRVAARARSTAPVRSGRYRDSIHVEEEVTDRVVKLIGSDVEYALVIESETGNLSRALDAAGGASARSKFNPAP